MGERWDGRKKDVKRCGCRPRGERGNGGVTWDLLCRRRVVQGWAGGGLGCGGWLSNRRRAGSRDTGASDNPPTRTMGALWETRSFGATGGWVGVRVLAARKQHGRQTRLGALEEQSDWKIAVGSLS